MEHDATGARTALVEQRHTGVPVRRWVMDPGLAEPAGFRTGAGDPGGLPDDAPPATCRLATYLRGADACALEQMGRCPTSPSTPGADTVN